MKTLKALMRDTRAGAIVEATILFPIMIMIFAGLVLLCMYLPSQANLQRATQYAATAIATERSDSWLFYDEATMSYHWADHSEKRLDNVYKAFFQSFSSGDDADKATVITEKIEERGIHLASGTLKVEYEVVNYIVYKEILVTATRTFPVIVDLSFIGFPKEISLTVTSTAIVQNGDEFVRNIDIAKDFIAYLDKKYNLSQMFQGVSNFSAKFSEILGWK